MNKALEDFKKQLIGGRERIFLTTELVQLFHDMVKEYLRKNYSEETKDEGLRGYSSTPGFYNEFVVNINNWIKKQNRADWQFLKGEYISNKFIVQICFEKKTLSFDDITDATPIKGHGVSRTKLLIVFEFLNEKLSEDEVFIRQGRRAGQHWLLKINQLAQSKRFLDLNYTIKYKGAHVIDKNFLLWIESKGWHYSKDDFYLQNDFHCQWYGIIKEWDYPRDVVKELVSEVIRSFNSPQKVPAVIAGTGGIGKSLCLKRVLFECVKEDFEIVWIVDYFVFFKNGIVPMFSEIDKKYLLVCDNWEDINADNRIVLAIKGWLEETKNTRLIICDRNPDGRIYRPWIMRGNIFKLPIAENKSILEKIITENDHWELVAKKISMEQLMKTPLYMVVFIIARTKDEKQEFSLSGDLLSRFADIIEYDIKKLHHNHKGLAFALVYWAQIHVKYRFGITWRAFLSIADDYNSDTSVTKQLFHFQNENTTHSILWHYVFLLGFVNPDLKNVHLMGFNHDLLLEQISKIEIEAIGLTKFVEPPVFDVLEILINKGMYNSASDTGTFISELAVFNENILGIEDQRKIYPEHQNILFPQDIEYIGIARLMYYDSLLKMLFASAHFDFEEFVWADHLYRLIFELGFDKKSLVVIIRKILDIGCQSECVKQVYYFLQDEGDRKIAEILASFDKKHDFNWIMKMQARTNYSIRKFVEFAEQKEVIYSPNRF